MTPGQAEQERRADARLERQLLQGGVGMRHVRRTLRELRDHRDDLQCRLLEQGGDGDAARIEAISLLGDRDRLAAHVIARPELRSRVHRFAWLLFVLGPLPLIALLCALSIIVGAALFEGEDRLWHLHLGGPREIVLTRMLFVWAIPAVVGLLLCQVAVRRAVPAVWPLCANGMVALTSAFTHVSGTTRVTAIYFGPSAEQGLARAPAFFVLLGVAYLLLRQAESRRMRDA
jgi:hypothetical protein